jgi:hypothetical protein
MTREFTDSYQQIFNCAYTRLNRAHKIKLLAIKFCNENAEKINFDEDKYDQETKKGRKSMTDVV